ncbi:membrane hypothetical protein [Tenacibaculum litopenaei]
MTKLIFVYLKNCFTRNNTQYENIKTINMGFLSVKGTSFHVSHFYLPNLFILFLAAVWGFYLLIKRLNIKISKGTFYTYVTLTLLGLVLVFFPTIFVIEVEHLFEVNSIMEIGIFIIAFSQLFLLISLFKGYSKLVK